MPAFTTSLIAATGNNAGIVVPDDVVFGFGRGKRVPVKVNVYGAPTFQSTVSSVSGQFLIAVDQETQKIIKHGIGDEVTVKLELDEEPPTVEVPEELAVLLSADPTVADAWNQLSYSKQRGFIDPINTARGEDSRQRRIEKVIKALRIED